MRPLNPAWIAMIGLMAAMTTAFAQPAQPPAQVADLPLMEIFSPTFFWSDETNVIRTGSITCPKGRAITAGMRIVQGEASLRIVESYPDGESWVIRVVNRAKPESVKSLQVRGFAMCMLPVARKSSVLIAQHTRIAHLSTRFAMQAGFVSTGSRQACPQGARVISGGFGLDPNYRAPNDLRLELSFPDPGGWNVRAINGAAGAAPEADARAYAVCIGGNEGADIRNYGTVYFVESDVVAKSTDGTIRQSMSCGERDAYVLAGGFRAVRGRSASLELQESFPDSSSSWTLAVINRGDRRAGDVTVRLYAVCIKK